MLTVHTGGRTGRSETIHHEVTGTVVSSWAALDTSTQPTHSRCEKATSVPLAKWGLAFTADLSHFDPHVDAAEVSLYRRRVELLQDVRA